MGEGSGPIRSDPERLPIAAVVSDKNVTGGGAALRGGPEPLAFPFLRDHLSRGVWSEIANIEKRRIAGYS